MWLCGDGRLRPSAERSSAGLDSIYLRRAPTGTSSRKLARAGFKQIEIEPTRIYRVEDAREFLSASGVDVDAIAPQVDEKFMSAFVRAVKPSGGGNKDCCAPACCR